ncbi:outer membrane lipoprotein carrier protein LolA [Candidatus Saganbacteria bacterium]|nr:outer membrane lipoprotein carrier protein LolA [Candidatus Saganbacteria bacterium]
MNKKFILGFVFFLAFSVSSFAMDQKIEDLLNKVRANQNKIEDMSADITTVIKSDMKDKKAMEQKGSIMVKGSDASRMEMTSPLNQVTITNKDKMEVLNPATGQKFVQDLKKLKGKLGQSSVGSSPIDQTKVLDYFDLKLEEKGVISKSYIITGVPKEKNKFMGMMKFYIDGSRNLPVKIEIYNTSDKLVSASDIDYTKVKDIWVISKNTSSIVVPGGKMEIEMRFDNVKVNEGLSDKLFEIK